MEGVHERVVQRAETLGLDEHPSDRLLLESVFAANHELDRMRGALDDQTADADALARAVRAVATLHDRSGEIEQRGEERLAMRVALSAKIALASPRVVVMHQLPDDEGWRIGSASDTERPASRFISVEDAPANLSTLIHGLRPNAPLAAIPELRATLDGFDDPMGAFVVPLTGRVLTGVVVYLCAGASPAAPSVIEALRLAWTEALDAEGGRTLASRMNEQLADANRRLAEAQSRLVETESLSRLAEVAAGAAHEMNNPLTIITGRSQMLAQAATNDQQRAFAQAIEVSARKLTDLVTSLRLYADPPQPKPSPLSLRDVLDRALRAALERARLVPGRERPDVRIIVEGPIPTFTLDGGQVTEAVTELITNALESEGCSVVEVRARRQTPEEAGAPDADAPEALVIAVTDNGSGMSERALRHACDPFFSEKRAGRQQGLGLARASRLAGLNGGEIRLQNLESGGLNASLVFPPAPSLLFHNAQQQSAA